MVYQPKNIFSFSIEARLLLALKDFCRKKGISASQFIRECIEARLGSKE